MPILHRVFISVILVLLQACGTSEPSPQKTMLTEITPLEALPGDTITISGKRLGRNPREIFVGSVTAAVTNWSSTEITAIVPDVGAATYPVYIRIGDWKSNELSLIVGENAQEPTPDTKAPETSISKAPSALTNATSAEFSFVGKDDSRVERFECRRDVGAWVTCASPFRYQSLGEGNHRFEVKAIDKGGNEDMTPASAEWQIDITPPESSISEGPATTTASTMATFVFVSSDTGDAGFACRLDADVWQSCASPMIVSDLTEGAHVLSVQAVDAVGNADPTPTVWNWSVDLTPPETNTTAGPASVTNSSAAVISFVGSDASLFSFECSFDAGAWQACLSPQIYDSLAEGNHGFAVRAVDAAGHSDATPATWDWLIDQTPPNTTLTTGPATITSATAAVLSFGGTDDVAVAGYECRLDAGAWVTCSSPKTYTSLSAGTYNFYVRAIDTVGNVESSPAATTWTIDLTPPNTSLASMPPSVTSATTADFAFNGTDNLAVDRYECQLDAGAWGACTSPISYTSLGAGAHTFDVRAVDTAGQADATPATYSWTIDLAPPDTTISSGPLAVTESTGATFVFSGTDNLGVARFECRLDTGAWLTCTSPKAYASLTSGSHTFEVRAVDTAGHADPTPAAWAWAIDGEPRIDERYPNVATLGTSLSLAGKYFGAVSGSVTIGGAPALIQGWSDSAIQVSVGNGTPKGAQPIIVTTDQGHMSNSMPISIRGSDVWLTGDIPEARSDATAVWTGKEMIVWGGSVYLYGYYQTGGRYNPITDTWVSTSQAGAPAGRQYHSAVWTGSEMIIWGGYNGAYLAGGARYNPHTDSWADISTAGAAPNARRSHSAVWTGTEMVIWGGYNGSTYLNTGANYDPSTNTWAGVTTTGAPTGRSAHAAVWSGSQMLIWGGLNGSTTGGRYDPALDTWFAMSTTGAPTARQDAGAIWTGTQMVVWGGYLGATQYNTGGRYDPQTDTWQSTTTTGAPTIRTAHSTVWTGTRMLVWGGYNASVNVNTGGRYDPVADSWQSIAATGAPTARGRHAAAWTGTHMLVWGGSGNVYYDDGGRYDPTANTWAAISGAGAPPGVRYHGAVWTGSQMIVWGGYDNPAYLNTGGRYNPTTDTWLSTTTSGAPSARAYHTAVWTGSRMVVWGGYYSNGFGYYQQTGARYDPATDSWNSTTVTGAPTGRRFHTALWTGTQMLIWGGDIGSSPLAGGRYDPTLNSWLAMSTAGEPIGRYGHTAVWTGTEMIVWGARSDQTGGRYDPNTDTWMSTAVTGAPAARYAHSAVWTGTEMVIWGGYYNSTYFNTGGKYEPATDTWSATSTVGAPTARRDHSAIWTGSEMVVWGGDIDPTGGRYDPSSDTWRSTTTVGAATRRETHSALWTGSEMLIWGGYRGGTELNSVGRYIP